jgi:hypothetical protein
MIPQIAVNAGTAFVFGTDQLSISVMRLKIPLAESCS